MVAKHSLVKARLTQSRQKRKAFQEHKGHLWVEAPAHLGATGGEGSSAGLPPVENRSNLALLNKVLRDRLPRRLVLSVLKLVPCASWKRAFMTEYRCSDLG